MVINDSGGSGHVKFISYDGEYPNLCRGKLVLEIDGKQVSFSYMHYRGEADYDDFWMSGGKCYFDERWNEHIESAPWQIDKTRLPRKFQKYVYEIDRVFNENVEYGCCGGCL